MSRGSISITTEIPGPKSREIAARKEQVVPAALGTLAPFYIAEGKGALVQDVDGNRFIDFTGGWGCLTVGHTPNRVVNAIQDQAAKYTHTDFTAVPYEPYVAFAERLANLAPGSSPKQVAFFNSGAEAIENAVKISRKHTKRKAIVVFEGAFHGRTLLTMTMTHKAVPYKAGFGPFAPDIYRLPLPNPYRNNMQFEDFERTLVALVDPHEVAAVVIEPLQGEGGFIVPADGFLEYLRELTAKHGILFVADEIQCGFGRTGKFFAIEHCGVEPDLITVAKSIAAGLPLSGVIGKKEVFDSIPGGAIGGTYVGNPLACRAGIEVLNIIEDEKLLDRAVAIGKIIRKRFDEMKGKYAIIGDVRGLGAMLGMELVKDPVTKVPAKDECDAVVQECLRNGVIIPSAGIYGNVLRMLVAAVITDDQLNEGLDVLDAAIAAVTN
ncbi:MAG TPA: 4-aminobutyrate--2-oxoglutarate transaminase [Candidatus Heimdallarchaeota archaeon]|nr:4-aminobutyrate--2-oxoglutarate transaminase [Candidatus Heimdallarchaeota archaeon]